MRCRHAGLLFCDHLTDACLRRVPGCAQGADGPPLDMALFDLGSKLSQMKVSQQLHVCTLEQCDLVFFGPPGS